MKIKKIALSFLISSCILANVNAGTITTGTYFNGLEGDTKSYPGSACNAKYGKQQNLIRTSGNNTYIYNLSKSSNKKIWVKCPMIEDKMVGGGRHDFFLRIMLYHPSNRTTACYLVRTRLDNKKYITSVKRTGKGRIKISFDIKSSRRYQDSTFYCKLDDGRDTNASYGATRLIAYLWSED